MAEGLPKHRKDSSLPCCKFFPPHKLPGSHRLFCCKKPNNTAARLLLNPVLLPQIYLIIPRKQIPLFYILIDNKQMNGKHKETNQKTVPKYGRVSRRQFGRKSIG